MNIVSTAGFKNVWVLSLSCALAGSVIPLMVLVGSLVGAELAPSVTWATAPIALMILRHRSGCNARLPLHAGPWPQERHCGCLWVSA